MKNKEPPLSSNSYQSDKVIFKSIINNNML